MLKLIMSHNEFPNKMYFFHWKLWWKLLWFARSKYAITLGHVYRLYKLEVRDFVKLLLTIVSYAAMFIAYYNIDTYMDEYMCQ